MSKTTVINIRNAPSGWQDNPQFVYCGRRNVYYKVNDSIWANPYRLVNEAMRLQVIGQYRQYVTSSPGLMERLPELKGKTLVCYCKPEACHCDVLVELIEGVEPAPIEAPEPEPQIKQLTLEVTAPVNAPVAPPEPFSEAFRQDYAQLGTDADKPFNLMTLKNSQADDTWYTPAPYVEAARLVMGSIELDPASDELGNETVKADRYFTKEDDGLSQEWNARTGFLNAPGKQKGSGQAEWLAKAETEYEAGRIKELIGCIFNASGIETRWFQNILGKYPLCLVGHRMRFIPRPGRYEPGTNNQPVHGNAFVYMGPNPEKFTEVFSQFGKVILPRQVAPKSEASNTDYAQLATVNKIPAELAYLSKDTKSKYHGVRNTTELIERALAENAALHAEIQRLTNASPEAAAMAQGLAKAVNELAGMDYQIVISVKCPDAPLGIVQAHGTAVWDVLDRAVQQVKAYKVGTHRKAEEAA